MKPNEDFGPRVEWFEDRHGRTFLLIGERLGVTWRFFEQEAGDVQWRALSPSSHHIERAEEIARRRDRLRSDPPSVSNGRSAANHDTTISSDAFSPLEAARVDVSSQMRRPRRHRFDFALSFAGSERPLAKRLKEALTSAGFAVFYDQDFEHEMLGIDGSVYLRKVYGTQSRFCIVLISRQYDQRNWTQLERESIQGRELAGERDCLIPVRVEDHIPEWLPTTRVFFDLSKRPVEDLVEVLRMKAAQSANDAATSSMGKKASFVLGLLGLLEPDASGHWRRRMLPDAILQSLPTDATPEAIVETCIHASGMEAVYARAEAQIIQEWHRLDPVFKRQVLDVISGCGVGAAFVALAPLTFEEERHLRIHWHVAERDYRLGKSAAYAKCAKLGVALGTQAATATSMPVKETMNRIGTLLCELLRSKVRIDREAIVNGAGSLEPSYLSKARGRAESEYLDILTDLRRGLAATELPAELIERHCLEPIMGVCNAIVNSAILPGGVPSSPRPDRPY